ncbi:TIGR01457 family HAD-type hydrolase [Halalkalibacillus halophilus]|uniref:TIGR01457 family HAD-type hydrolase n=1 Tax=Halalkalibacillus halophilus TaxID=392827 RepID=UPI000406B2EA|nr:TIGR01457 family HAD-type hydrolase [Halalkalibacillus halophilus]
MKEYGAYFIDLDGTMYKGKEAIPEAKPFIDQLVSKGIPHLFVTNNSSRTQAQTVDKLKGYGVEATKDQILTPSITAAKQIKQDNPSGAKVYAIGEIGLFDALEQEGLTITEESPDYVVIGIDRDNSYRKIREACLHIQAGAQFVATNPDIKVPTEKGLVPGNGAFMHLMELVTGVKPKVFGKPEHYMITQALNQLNVAPEHAIMIGDNYHTDILAGIRAGVDTLHVQTGVTSVEELRLMEDQPTYSLKSLQEWFT